MSLRPRLRALLSFGLLLPISCSTRPRTVAVAPVPTAARMFELVRPEYSGEQARAIVAFMEPHWRLPGNAGFDASIMHVADYLSRAGFVEEGKAGRDAPLTYRIERRRMTSPTWEPESASLSVVGLPTPLLRWETNRNMLAINSYSTPPRGVEAEVVDAGEGTPAQLDAAKVRGRIVLARTSVSRLFVDAVQKRGAVGVLAYSLPAYLKPQVHKHSIQFSRIPLDTTQRSWGILLSTSALESLQRAMAAGTVRLRVAVAARSYVADELTLVADARGSDRRDERFVFSAHVQEPGANDNASGVGAQAEMARVLASLVRSGKVAPRRTISFIWGNEISATRRYLEEDSVRTRGVRWGMSLDMVGEDTQKTGGTFLIEKMPDPSAVWTRGEDRHTEWGGEALEVADLTPHFFNDFVLRRCLEQASVTGWVVRTNPYEGGSDHVPFLSAKKPGLLLWHFTDEFYHTDRDRLENVSSAELANVGISALVAALTLATPEEQTAPSVAAEIERAALDRLAAERALGTTAVASGGDRSREALILRTWSDWYRAALATVAEIDPGDPSPATRTAIDAADARVRAAGEAAIAAICGGAC